MEMLTQFWDKFSDEILQRGLEHLRLTFIAMLIATSIALPLGILLARDRFQRFSNLVIGAAGVVQTVPTLALMAIIVLLFALIALPTIGALPAVVALVLYALLPILRNSYTGIRQVDPSVKEVAVGMGMKPSQVLFQVELPLALPVIMAGIRISTVWTIGVATLCALIGAGGLGSPIVKGLSTFQMDYVVAGTVPAALIAVVADAALNAIEKWLTPPGADQAQ